jgi:hypothetical protein
MPIFLFFVFIEPYRTRPRDGENIALLHVTPSVKITPKILAKFAFGDLRLGGCLWRPPPPAPARAQSPTRNTRIKRRNFREDFVSYFGIPGQGFLSQNLRFELENLNGLSSILCTRLYIQ